MNEELEQFLTGGKPAEQVPESPSEPEPVAAEAVPVAEEPTSVAESEPEAPPQPTEGAMVPRSALEATRRDWKEKWAREEEQRKAKEAELERIRAEFEAFKKQAAQPPQPAPVAQQSQAPQVLPPPPNPAEDPQGYAYAMQRQIINERLHFSEMVARKEHPDMDEKFAIFKRAVEMNPAIHAEVMNDPHPWERMYREAKRIEMLEQIGPDPDAYRAKIESEARAKWEAEYAAKAPPPAPPPPQINPAAGITTPSLGSARGSAPRSAPAFTGPLSVDQLFP